MLNYFQKALQLLISGDKILWEIIGTTMTMSIFSSIISLILGVVIGVFIGNYHFLGRKLLRQINRTFMGLPPVVAGLFVFILFSGVGMFGKLQLIYTLPVMVIAQILLITPVVAGMTENHLATITTQLNENLKGLNIKRGKKFLLAINEIKIPLISVFLTGFSRSLAEVGAVSLVGGNILHHTRVLTTAIVSETNMGNFQQALAMGIILLLISFIINFIITILEDKKK